MVCWNRLRNSGNLFRILPSRTLGTVSFVQRGFTRQGVHEPSHHRSTIKVARRSLATTQGVASAIANATFSPEGPPHIFDLNAAQLQEFTDVDDLEMFVTAVEDTPDLSQRHLHLWVLPLARIVSMKRYGEKGAQLTERILWNCLRRLPKHPDDRNDQHPVPPGSLFNKAMIAWGNVGDRHDRVETIFQWQVQAHKNDSLSDPPDRKSYKSRIRAWAQTEPGTAYKILRKEMEPLSGVPELLKEDHQLVEKPYDLELPDLATYNLVAMSYAKGPVLRHPIALGRILEIFDRVKRLEDATGNTGEYALDGHSYVAIMLAYRRQMLARDPATRDIAGSIEGWLKDIYVKIHNPDPLSLQREAVRALDGNVPKKRRDPDMPLFPLSMSWAYGVWIDAILQAGSEQSVEMAEQVILDMVTGSVDRSIYQCVPTNQTIVKVTNAWTKFPGKEERIYDLLRAVVLNRKYKTTREINVAMKEWSDIPAPQHTYVPELLESILDKALKSYVRKTHDNKTNKPTGQSFLLVMRSWLRCSNNDLAPHRLEQVFVDLVQRYESPDSWYRPHESHLRCLFTAYVIRCNTGKLYYAAGVTALPAEHCERVLRWLISKPWITTNRAAGFCGMTLRSFAIQEGMDDTERLDRSMALLDTFFRGEGVPSYPANWVLTACARDYATIELQTKAYETASSIFVRKDININHRSYDLMVDVVEKHYLGNQDNAETKSILIRELFHRACTAGMLSQDMVRKFVQTVRNPDMIQKDFGLDYTYAQMVVQYSEHNFLKLPKPLLVQNLPPEWSINVKEPVRKIDGN